MIYLGVDPGMTGAIGIVRTINKVKYIPGNQSNIDKIDVVDFDSPQTLALLGLLVSEPQAIFAMVEKVNAMPKQGVSTTFKFGVSYGRVMGWLDAYQIPYELVTPQKWWKAMSDSAPRKDKKEMALDLARRLFPSIAASHLARKKDHNRAEALLIAEYCKRMKSGGP